MASLREQLSKIDTTIKSNSEYLLEFLEYYKGSVQKRFERHAEATAERVNLYYEWDGLIRKAKDCDKQLSKIKKGVSVEELAAMYTKIEELKTKIAESNTKIDELLIQEQSKGDDTLRENATAMHAQVLVYRINLAKQMVASEKMSQKMPSEYVTIAKDLSRTELDYRNCDAKVTDIENEAKNFIRISFESSIENIGKRDANYDLKVKGKEHDREIVLNVLEKIFKSDCERGNVLHKLSMRQQNPLKQAGQKVEENKAVVNKDQDVASTDDESAM